MSFGHADFIRNEYVRGVQVKVSKIKGAYEAAREKAESTMQAMVLRDTGALAESSTARMLPNGLGFVMESFGNKSTGKSYARFINSGHNVIHKDGSITFVPAVPYFSQAEADARTELMRQLRSGR